MSNISNIDQALDRYIKNWQRTARTTPKHFTRLDVARTLGVSEEIVSDWLQQYRLAQVRPHNTRYVIQAKGYGIAARWTILSKPGDDPAVIRKARKDAAKWIARDSAKRFVKDANHELGRDRHIAVEDSKIQEAIDYATPKLQEIREEVERILNGVR